MTRAETIALLGRLAEALGLALLIPLGVALAHGEPAWLAFAAPAALGLGVGALSRRFAPLIGRSGSSTDGSRAYRFVVLAWCLCTVFGALPYVAEFGFGFAVNGLFESASGFSTTGATIFPEVEWLPRSLLLWRAMTQWLGGLGIIIIFVWLLGRRQWGVDVLSAEAPGPTAEKTEPKITETARDTVIVGSVLTAILIGILVLLDVPAFDAVCHAFTTLATGGFSTRNASVGAFDPAVQWVIIAFMVIGGMRFAIHIYEIKRIVAGVKRLWRRLRGGSWKRVSAAPAASYFSDPELRLYIGVVAVSTGLLFLSLYLMGQGSMDGLRQAAFTAIAVITTTGYSVVDYNQWSDFSRMLVLVLMFAGGCAGSTAGSIKILRWVILFRKVPLALRVATQPHTELRVHIGRRPVALVAEFDHRGGRAPLRGVRGGRRAGHRGDGRGPADRFQRRRRRGDERGSRARGRGAGGQLRTPPRRGEAHPRGADDRRPARDRHRGGPPARPGPLGPPPRPPGPFLRAFQAVPLFPG